MADLAGPTGLMVQVQPGSDLDPEEHAELTDRLRTELLDNLDLTSADPVDAPSAPAGAKGLGTLVGWLVVQFGTVETLRAVVNAVRSWVGRTNHVVELAYAGDVLKVTGVTSEQQEKIIDDWLARHATGA
ncbi:hypothetical protein [Kitasatospora sp. NPDC051914]|uniref:hypothetical protein n=1 Tax=Kitasatospora sp. NPDC051914 TaxID=3154945 RepID=UPI003433AD85